MKRLYQTLLYLLVGGIGFWLPDIVLNAKREESFALHTILPIIGLIVSYLIMKVAVRDSSGPSLAFFMMIGLWCLGSTAMTVGASFFPSGGFALGISDSLLAIALGLLPPYMLIMATYDFSVVAVLLASGVLFLAYAIFERSNWVLPPSFVAWFKRKYERTQTASGQ